MSKNKSDYSLLLFTSERSQLIAYLRYAVEDVELISQQSAFFLKMAVQILEEEEGPVRQ